MFNSNNKLKHFIFICITIFIAVCCLLIAAEVTLRLTWSGKEKTLTKKRPNQYRPADNKIISYTLKPNHRYKTLKFKTNRDGFRIDPAIKREKQPGEYRIALIGDSIVFGYNTISQCTIGHFLETDLNIYKYNSKTKFQVLNFGIPGYNMPQYLEVMKEYVFAYHPDLIVVNVTICNDFNGYKMKYLDEGCITVEPVCSVHGYNYELKVPPAFIRNLYLYRLIHLKWGKSWKQNLHGVARQPDEKPFIRKNLPASCDPDDTIWTETAGILDKMVELSKENNCNLLFLFYPSREQIVYPDIPRTPQSLLASMLTERGQSYIDLFSVFEHLYRSSDYLPFRDAESHPDNQMYTRVAFEIKNFFFDKFRKDIVDWNDFNGEIDFTGRGINKYVSYGWGDKGKLDKKKITWVVGAESELIFPGFKNKAETISFEAVKYPECKYQQVRVALNEKLLGTYDMSSSDTLRIYKVVPRDPITLQPVNHLQFRFLCSALEPDTKSTKIRTPIPKSAGFSYVRID